MAKFKRASNGVIVEAVRWLAGNEPEVVEFMKDKFNFAIAPDDPTKGVLFGVSHDTLTGRDDGQVWFPINTGDWIVEFSQAGHPIYLGFTDDEMHGKWASPLEEPPVAEETND